MKLFLLNAIVIFISLIRDFIDNNNHSKINLAHDKFADLLENIKSRSHKFPEDTQLNLRIDPIKNYSINNVAVKTGNKFTKIGGEDNSLEWSKEPSTFNLYSYNYQIIWSGAIIIINYTVAIFIIFIQIFNTRSLLDYIPQIPSLGNSIEEQD